MPGLRDILEAATRKPWVIHNYNEVWVHHDGDPAGPPATKVAQTIFGDDARLVALAPELAALCLDMGAVLDAFVYHQTDAQLDNARALLARLDSIGKEQR